MKFFAEVLEMRVPEKIARLIMGAEIEKRPPGFSGSEIYIIRAAGGKHERYFYLKHMPAARLPLCTLRREAEAMRWLRGKLPAPEAVEFETAEDGEYLLMTAIPGRSFAGALDVEPLALARKYAGALRRVHDVPISGCPFDESNAVKARRALERCDAGLCRPEYFREDRRGMSAPEIRRLLLNTPAPAEDPVFTHGDYCFPNVILGQNGEIAGYVDLASAGAADRYQDVAVGARSVYFNMRSVRGLGAAAAGALTGEFLRAYGLERPDAEKMEYFQLLDDFFR